MYTNMMCARHKQGIFTEINKILDSIGCYFKNKEERPERNLSIFSFLRQYIIMVGEFHTAIEKILEWFYIFPLLKNNNV